MQYAVNGCLWRAFSPDETRRLNSVVRIGWMAEKCCLKMLSLSQIVPGSMLYVLLNIILESYATQVHTRVYVSILEYVHVYVHYSCTQCVLGYEKHAIAILGP